MRHRASALGSLVLLLVLASTARAQERFFTTPDMAGGRYLAVRSALAAARRDLGDSENDPGFWLRHRMLISFLQLEGGATIGGGVAVTAVLPFAMVTGHDGEADGAGLGNPTLDLRMQRSLRAGDHMLIAGGGVAGSLGLASSETAAAVASFFYQDLGRFWPYGHTLRLHGDGGWQYGPVFAQLQIGLDHHAATGEYRDYGQTLARLGLGAGVLARPDVALLAELTTLSNLFDSKPTDAAESERVASALELGARWHRRLSVGVSLFVPFRRRIASNYTAEIGVGFELISPL
jgi:hypothetical protein